MPLYRGRPRGGGQYFTTGGIIYVRLGVGEAPPEYEQIFQFGGTLYLWRPGEGFFQYGGFKIGQGLIWNQVANVQWFPHYQIQPFAPPTTIGAKPGLIWGQPIASNYMGLSAHIDQMRCLRVVCYNDGAVPSEVPLIDANDIPWLDPEHAPKVVVRKDAGSTATLETGTWTDRAVNVRWYERAGTTPVYGLYDTGIDGVVEWSIRQKSDPVPHWIFKTESYESDHVILAYFLGTGAGKHASATRTNGSAGTTGYWSQELIWTQQDFISTPTLAVLNERKFAEGALHVANAVPSTIVDYLYLTTGANMGTVTGDAFFTEMPMVQVLGHADLNVDVTASDETAWKPESWGMGVDTTNCSNAALDNSGGERAYYTELRFISGHYRVGISNCGMTDSSDTTASTKDRTFFVFAVGV
jgi:hypothetical protein